MKVYGTFVYNKCDKYEIQLKVFKDKEAAEKWCAEQPKGKCYWYDYNELDAEGF